jgi:hypothetical protein
MSLCHETKPINLASTLPVICTIPLSVDAHITWFMGRLDGGNQINTYQMFSNIFLYQHHINTSPSNDYG